MAGRAAFYQLSARAANKNKNILYIYIFVYKMIFMSRVYIFHDWVWHCSSPIVGPRNFQCEVGKMAMELLVFIEVPAIGKSFEIVIACRGVI